MSIKYIREPDLIEPIMIASWPGIGNIGLIAVDSMRRALHAEEMAYIEPWDFFYPNKVIIRGGELVDMQFPSSEFYYKRTDKCDLIFFVGEEQPAEGGRVYAEGSKAYVIANMVLDVAEKYRCRRIYTSGAAVAPIHHTAYPRVWAVPNNSALLPEIRGYTNTILMSDIEGRGGEGQITGLNGLLLGVAKRRGIDAICVMGEIPIYLQGFPFPYPKASKSVLEALMSALGIWVDTEHLNTFAQQNEHELSDLYEKLPPEIKEQLDRLKQINTPSESPGGITEEDKKKILEDIDKFFKHEGREDQH